MPALLLVPPRFEDGAHRAGYPRRVLPGGSSASYATARAGVVVFSRHAANEVGKHGLPVNCVAPSAMLTERMRCLMPEARRRGVAAMSPPGRMEAPEDVAPVTLDSSSWPTGITLGVAEGGIML